MLASHAPEKTANGRQHIPLCRFAIGANPASEPTRLSNRPTIPTVALGSGYDAVDGSSTGTSVPWMWALLRLPRFRGESHADDNDNRFRHRQVSFPGSRR